MRALGGMMRCSGKTIAAVLTSLSFGCSASITRYGYTLDDVRESRRNPDCAVPIKAKAVYEKHEVKRLAAIRARESLFTVTCDEAYVLGIFSHDACALGAHVVNITDETQPGTWNTCYRADADLLLFRDASQAERVQSDPRYEQARIEERAREGKKKNQAMLTLAIVAGVIGGLSAGAMAARNR